MSKDICPNCGTYININDFFCQECGFKLSSQVKPIYYGPKSRLNDYKGYIQIIGAVEIVFGILAIFIAGLIGFVTALIPIFVTPEALGSTPDFYGDVTTFPASSAAYTYDLFLLIIVIMGIITLISFIYGILAILYGRRLLNLHKTGRTGSMIISGLSLIAIPMGTIFGIFALYVLTRAEVEQILT